MAVKARFATPGWNTVFSLTVSSKTVSSKVGCCKTEGSSTLRSDPVRSTTLRLNGLGFKVAVAGLTLASCLPPVDLPDVASDAGVDAIGGAGGTDSTAGTGGAGGSGGTSSGGTGGTTGEAPSEHPDGPSEVGLPDGGIGAGGGPATDPDAGGAPVTPDPPKTPLILVGVQPPPPSALGVPVDTPLSLTFSTDVDPASASLLTIELSRSGSLPISGAIVVEGPRVRFVPSEPLLLTSEYSWHYEGALRSTAGAEWTGSADAHFQTRAGQWGAPENLASSGDTPRVAVDGAGNALAIWSETGIAAGGQASLGIRRLTSEGVWQTLPTPATCGPLCTPDLVAGGDDGAFEMVWFAVDRLYARRFHPDAGFGATQSILARSGPPAAAGVVADGQLWMAADEAPGITVSRSTGSTPWVRTNVFISDDRHGTAGPVIVVDGPERARVFWLESSQLSASTLSEGSWSSPQFVPNVRGDFTPGGFSGAGVASGNALLAWEEDRPSAEDPSVLSSFLGVTMMGSNGAILEEDGPTLPEGTAGNPASPAVAMNPGAEALLTWRQSAGDPNDASIDATLWAAFHPATQSGWSAPVQLPVESDGLARPPAVGIDPGGNGHVLWVSVDGAGNASVLTARFRKESGTFGAPEVISGAAPAAPGLTRGPRSGNDNCQLAVDGHGRALAIWAGPDGGIWAARFE
jgi:hypothetical protein